MAAIDDFTHEPRVAYFSMEIALHNEVPTYSGGSVYSPVTPCAPPPIWKYRWLR